MSAIKAEVVGYNFIALYIYNLSDLLLYLHFTMAVMHHGSYVPINDAVFLTELPSSVTTTELEVPLPDTLPDNTTEVLLYLFVTAKTASEGWRSYYEVYTKDANGVPYKKYMNVAMATDDFTLNSANLWLPIFNEKKFYITIPDDWPMPTLATTRSAKIVIKTIKDSIKALRNPTAMVSGSFLSGYRTATLTR